MSKHYILTDAVRGSFAGARGRVTYDIAAGPVSDKDVDPEVLARLIAAGVAVKTSKRARTTEEESAL